MLLTARGYSRAVWWISAAASSENSGSDRPARERWWRRWLLVSSPGVAQPDPLVQGGEDTEFHLAPQGGLPDEQAGERAGGVHVVVGQHPH
jgi:hypothetical protein